MNGYFYIDFLNVILTLQIAYRGLLILLTVQHVALQRYGKICQRADSLYPTKNQRASIYPQFLTV